MKCWLCKKQTTLSWQFSTWNKNKTESKLRDYCSTCANQLIFDDSDYAIGVNVIGVKAKPERRKIK